MLKHLQIENKKPERVVVLGSQGFVGNHSMRRLKQDGINVFGISKNEINLLHADAEEKLLATLQTNDTLVIISAIAPCKNRETLIDNLKMMEVVCKVIEKISLSQIIYISSDAVYHEDINLVTEQAATAPASFHGMMHSCRELMLKQAVKKIPLAILRPSLLYGLEDPHNSYGPNRFRRLAEKNENIILFGQGEEKRDHVFIEDAAHIISLVACHRSEGILNIATGTSIAFKQVAEEIKLVINTVSEIQTTSQNNPVIHRHFDATACYQAFPAFRYLSFSQGLKSMLHPRKIYGEVA